eukprot:13405.XXX_618393_618545_1 [CDS] Oithona nana genome sequencing.
MSILTFVYCVILSEMFNFVHNFKFCSERQILSGLSILSGMSISVHFEFCP